MACYRRDENDNPIVESCRTPQIDEWGDLVSENNYMEMDRILSFRKKVRDQFTIRPNFAQ